MYHHFNTDFTKYNFVWDEEKEKKNFKDHGIHFKTAIKVFLDPMKLIREDEEHPVELRYNVIGKIGKIVFVVFAFRKNKVIRIISARIASQPEKERYEYGKDDFT